MTTSKSSQSSCRYKVYMYDLRGTRLSDVSEKQMQYHSIWGYRTKIQEVASGGSIWNSEQLAGALMMIDRIRRSKCRVKNPEIADIFFIPAFAMSKHDKTWQASCNITEKTFLKYVPHLTKRNACRHFIFVAKTFTACSTGSWYYQPKDSRLATMIRLAYDEPLFYNQKLHEEFNPYPYFHRTNNSSFSLASASAGLLSRCQGRTGSISTNSNCMVSFPHVYSVPYPSSLRYERKEQNLRENEYVRRGYQQPGDHPPLSTSAFTDSVMSKTVTATKTKAYKKRTILMLFVGHIHKREAKTLRVRMDDMGKRYNDKHIYLRPSTTKVEKFATLFQKAIFCLQPGGDSPCRKSISDAVALGCIPVFFGNVTASQYSWFFQRAQDTHIDIDIDAFMQGKIDLKQYLQSIPPRRIRYMQLALQKVKKAFTYNRDDEVGEGDAIDRIFDLVAQHASSSERCHIAKKRIRSYKDP